MEKFYFGEIEFHLRAITEINLPPYKGGVLRGALGQALRKLSCNCREFQSDSNSPKHICAYGYLMATSVFHSSKTSAQSPPHPLILEPPVERKGFYAPGEELSLKAVLIGKAINYLTYILLAVQRMGQAGVGRDRGKFVLDRVEAVDLKGRETIYSDNEPLLSTSLPQIRWQDIVDQVFSLGNVESITLEFITPVRLKKSGGLVDGKGVDFTLVMAALLRRISRLNRYYCETDERLDFEDLMGTAERVTIADSDLRWYDWTRYSAAQLRTMKLGGLLGYITFTGDLLPFLPYLILGSHIHIGKNTVFGLGKYEVIINRRA